MTVCGSLGVDLSRDSANCGACGYFCLNGRTCERGRCTPAWLPMTTIGQPTEKDGTAAVGIGGKLLVTGGPCDVAPAVANSKLYDSKSDTWMPTGPMKAARAQHIMVSTGTMVYAFGGLSNCLNGTTIGPGLEVFDPVAKTWTTVTAPNEPPPRYAFGMTWTGSEVFLYGGSGGDTSGGRYNPSSAKWTDASCNLSGCARFNENLFAANRSVFMWDGTMGDALAGKQYDLTTGTWAPWSRPDVQLPGKAPDDGRRIFVLSSAGSGCAATTTVTIYDRASGQQLLTESPPAPDGVVGATRIVWTGEEVIAWSGGCGAWPANGGGRYQPPP